MEIGDIVRFWRGEQASDQQGRWAHRLDRKMLDAESHSFNLDHPVSPYVGRVLTAPVIILGANAGYKAKLTPTEFPDEAAVKAYLDRVDDPESADWSFVSRYYDDTNYGHLIASGRAALVNGSAYRSPRLSEEPENEKLIQRLPSSVIVRRWLLEAVLPLARKGERLIVIKRGGQWKLPGNITSEPGVTKDPAPVSPLITSKPYAVMTAFLKEHA